MFQNSGNVFDQLEALAPPKPSDLRSELDRYLNSDVENVADAVSWWYEKRTTFPQLSRMALDYLSIPGEPFLMLVLGTQNLIVP